MLVPTPKPGRWCRGGCTGAGLHDDDAVVAHVQRMLAAGGIVAQGGKVMPTAMHSICVHGDTPGAVANARRLRAALESAGWRLVGLPEAIADAD